ncbi:protein FAR1-RELATED SEQUENCE 4-like [Spinacia oleracea]|uniref:Protein FAR1-RELATED SEQUENCE 4-like n=1 Tax=Spinacia oleracea TaxID=3562 RepID=A0A9R0IKD5_SPIOL|nr:protein FAR1-RELATED SEQUENCE 4-like [Spinacia oleracea]
MKSEMLEISDDDLGCNVVQEISDDDSEDDVVKTMDYVKGRILDSEDDVVQTMDYVKGMILDSEDDVVQTMDYVKGRILDSEDDVVQTMDDPTVGRIGRIVGLPPKTPQKTPTVGIMEVVPETPKTPIVGIMDDVVPPPQVGMVIGTNIDQENDYYKSYGRQEGFGVARSGASDPGKGPGKVLTTATWTCDCFGEPDKRHRRPVQPKRVLNQTNLKNSRKSRKCGCKALMYAGVTDGQWVVRKVVLEHTNHTPTPSKSRTVFQHREYELGKLPLVKKKIFEDTDSGMSVPQIHRQMERQRNGYEEFPLTLKDMHNLLAKKRRKETEDGDAQAMDDYFNKMQQCNQDFYHVRRLDAEGYLKDVLWVDARSRAAYKDFGDAVCFDATYLVNKFNLPFANFVGVNHHGQSILLGSALISHENTETYTWVFQSWLTAMGGKYPNAILTDQDGAMRNSLTIAMPHTRHRWCLWHITSKFGVKLGKKEKYEELKAELLNVIYDSLAPNEFEKRWEEFMERFKLKKEK